MRRFNTLMSSTLFSSLFAVALLTVWTPSQVAHAQPDEEPEMTFDEDEAEPEMTFDEDGEVEDLSLIHI